MAKRRIAKVENKVGAWAIFEGDKKIGDIEAGRKDFRIFFYGGFALYRKTKDEAFAAAMTSPTGVGPKKVIGANGVALPFTRNISAASVAPAMPSKPKKTEKTFMVKYDSHGEAVPERTCTKADDSMVDRVAASMTLPILYAAYGMNTSKREMASRCPTAQYVGKAKVQGWRLQFRGCADIVRDRNAEMEVALWLCYPNDVAALDRLEGYPNGYIKVNVPVSIERNPKDPSSTVHTRAMAYVMTNRRRERAVMPTKGYENTLREGYADFGMDVAQIEAALDEAREDDEPRPVRSFLGEVKNWYSNE